MLNEVTLAFSRAPRSASSATTAPASPAPEDHGRPRLRLSGATRRSRPARRSACSSRSRTSTRARTSRATSRTASPRRQGAARPLQRARGQLLRRDRREFAELQAKIDAADAWNLDTQLEYAMDALRLPPADADVTKLSGGERRRVALCRLLLSSPTCCCSTSRPTTSTPSRSPGSSSTSPSTRARSSRSPTTATSSTTSPAGSSSSTAAAASVRGQLLGWLEQKQARLAHRGEGRQGAPADDRGRARMGAPEPEGPPDEAEGAAGELRGAARRGAQRQARPGPDPHPGRPAPGDVVVEAEGLRKGFGDRLLIEDLNFTLPRGGIVGVIGANGAGKTTLFRMITGQEQPDGGRCASATPSSSPTSTRPATRSTATRPSGRRSRAAWTRSRSASAWMNSRAYVARLQLQGLRPAEEGRQALRRRAQPPAPGQAPALRRQPAAPRRADERPRRRHAARARRGAARLRRLRGGHLPRSLVPRPRRDARAGLRGRLAGHAGSRATSRSTRPPPRAPRRRGRPPAPPDLQAPDAHGLADRPRDRERARQPLVRLQPVGHPPTAPHEDVRVDDRGRAGDDPPVAIHDDEPAWRAGEPGRARRAPGGGDARRCRDPRFATYRAEDPSKAHRADAPAVAEHHGAAGEPLPRPAPSSGAPSARGRRTANATRPRGGQRRGGPGRVGGRPAAGRGRDAAHGPDALPVAQPDGLQHGRARRRDRGEGEDEQQPGREREAQPGPATAGGRRRARRAAPGASWRRRASRASPSSPASARSSSSRWRRAHAGASARIRSNARDRRDFTVPGGIEHAGHLALGQVHTYRSTSTSRSRSGSALQQVGQLPAALAGRARRPRGTEPRPPRTVRPRRGAASNPRAARPRAGATAPRRRRSPAAMAARARPPGTAAAPARP